MEGIVVRPNSCRGSLGARSPEIFQEKHLLPRGFGNKTLFASSGGRVRQPVTWTVRPGSNPKYPAQHSPTQRKRHGVIWRHRISRGEVVAKLKVVLVILAEFIGKVDIAPSQPRVVGRLLVSCAGGISNKYSQATSHSKLEIIGLSL